MQTPPHPARGGRALALTFLNPHLCSELFAALVHDPAVLGPANVVQDEHAAVWATPREQGTAVDRAQGGDALRKTRETVARVTVRHRLSLAFQIGIQFDINDLLACATEGKHLQSMLLLKCRGKASDMI